MTAFSIPHTDDTTQPNNAILSNSHISSSTSVLPSTPLSLPNESDSLSLLRAAVIAHKPTVLNEATVLAWLPHLTAYHTAYLFTPVLNDDDNVLSDDLLDYFMTRLGKEYATPYTDEWLLLWQFPLAHPIRKHPLWLDYFMSWHNVFELLSQRIHSEQLAEAMPASGYPSSHGMAEGEEEAPDPYRHDILFPSEGEYYATLWERVEAIGIQSTLLFHGYHEMGSLWQPRYREQSAATLISTLTTLFTDSDGLDSVTMETISTDDPIDVLLLEDGYCRKPFAIPAHCPPRDWITGDTYDERVTRWVRHQIHQSTPHSPAPEPASHKKRPHRHSKAYHGISTMVKVPALQAWCDAFNRLMPRLKKGITACFMRGIHHRGDQ